MAASVVEKPKHVPSELVFEINPLAVPPEQDPHITWKGIQNSAPPIFWTPYGGHWVVTRAEDIKTVQLDYDRFSHEVFGTGQLGPLRPLSSDPPVNKPYRKIIMGAFLPSAIGLLEARAREIARRLVDELAPRGECEFMADFANVLPMEIFLQIVGLPSSDRKELIDWVEKALHSSDPEIQPEALGKLRLYIERALEERRRNSGDDLLSIIANADIEGRRISHQESMEVATLIMLGGLDTVASMLGFVARSLAMNPEHRRRLVDADPALMQRAIEEMIRRHGLSNTLRKVTRDMDYKGIFFRQGDVVQQVGSLYGLDETLVVDPMALDFDRERIPHTAFGSGVHLCPGQMLARREIKVFLEEWLARIPEFSIKPGTQPKMKFAGLISMVELHLVWPLQY